MKSVLISINPKWCEKILNGKKTVEMRKTKPKLETPFKCYIYCTKPSKKFQTICGCTILNSDELYRLPGGEIKHGCSIELMGCDNYTKDNFLDGKVVGEFICDKIEEFAVGSVACDEIQKLACLSYEEMINYFYKPNELDGNTAKVGYGWRISDLKIYDKPKMLWEFGLKKAPQSWCYVEV